MDESDDAWTVTVTLWRWQGGAWHFVTLPQDVSDEIEDQHAGAPGGFGAVRVEVTVGATTWRTSLFPSREEEAYVLPVKKGVRAAEGLVEGGSLTVRVRPV